MPNGFGGGGPGWFPWGPRGRPLGCQEAFSDEARTRIDHGDDDAVRHAIGRFP
jgi:hypothetical protein